MLLDFQRTRSGKKFYLFGVYRREGWLLVAMIGVLLCVCVCVCGVCWGGGGGGGVGAVVSLDEFHDNFHKMRP